MPAPPPHLSPFLSALTLPVSHPSQLDLIPDVNLLDLLATQCLHKLPDATPDQYASTLSSFAKVIGLSRPALMHAELPRHSESHNLGFADVRTLDACLQHMLSPARLGPGWPSAGHDLCAPPINLPIRAHPIARATTQPPASTTCLPRLATSWPPRWATSPPPPAVSSLPTRPPHLPLVPSHPHTHIHPTPCPASPHDPPLRWATSPPPPCCQQLPTLQLPPWGAPGPRGWGPGRWLS